MEIGKGLLDRRQVDRIGEGPNQYRCHRARQQAVEMPAKEAGDKDDASDDGGPNDEELGLDR